MRGEREREREGGRERERERESQRAPRVGEEMKRFAERVLRRTGVALARGGLRDTRRSHDRALAWLCDCSRFSIPVERKRAHAPRWFHAMDIFLLSLYMRCSLYPQRRRASQRTRARFKFAQN